MRSYVYTYVDYDLMWFNKELRKSHVKGFEIEKPRYR
jgi:hypothetical protein